MVEGVQQGPVLVGTFFNSSAQCARSAKIPKLSGKNRGFGGGATTDNHNVAGLQAVTAWQESPPPQ